MEVQGTAGADHRKSVLPVLYRIPGISTHLMIPDREMEAGVIPAAKHPTSLKTVERSSLMQPAHLRT